jgi:hypothetical protein
MWRLLSSLWKRSSAPVPERPPEPAPPPAPEPEAPAREPFPIVETPFEGYSELRPLDNCVGGQAFRALDPTGSEVILSVLERNGYQWPEHRPAELLTPYRQLRSRYLLPLRACHVEAERVVLVWEPAGESLHDRFESCRRAGRAGIPAGPLLGYLGEAASALDHLHSRGITCRSLRPKGLLLRGEHARVWDYVAVQLLPDAPLAMPTRYFAPEEVLHPVRVTAAGDQYRLGVIYQQMRTGKLPFGGTTMFEILQQITTANPDLSPLAGAERPVVGRALDRDPARRFGSCAEFVQALKDTLAPDCLRALPGRSGADPAWLAWNGGTVGRLAADIDDSHDFGRLPLLADALEDAGCNDAELLGHLRLPGPHVRGCRALGLLLG